MNLILTGKWIAVAGLVFWQATTVTRAQSTNDTVSLPEIIEGAQQWAQENLDTNVIAALPQIDPAEVQRFYAEFQARSQGDEVVDLAALRPAAYEVLGWLETQPETQPYAAWLKAQLDYLDMAEQIRAAAPLPKNGANQPPRVLANPAPPQERALWTGRVTGRPWPASAKAYVTELKPVFAAQNVPPELVWVAEVESAFDRRAASPAGAAGLFQLMPDTARRFGLSLWPRDQRFQAIPSARASAEYLKYLYDRFQDWRLVMAAYNAGEGTVQKLLDGPGARDYDAIAPHLPAETQMYVPRVEAVLWERERARLEQLPPPQT